MKRLFLLSVMMLGVQPMESATMFRGMQQALNKLRKKSDDTTIEEPGIVPVHPAAILLETERRQQIIQELKLMINLSDSDFDKVFMAVINNFAEFVQELPETQTSYFSHQGGILDLALERTLMTMQMCRTYLLTGDETLDKVSAYEMLWIYAVFSASLLLDVGTIATKQIITLYDANGAAIKIWSPYSGSMIGQGAAYKFEFIQENLDHLRNLVAPILARQIMPVGELFDDSDGEGATSHLPTGFLSIASEPKILEAWLAMFTGDIRGTGTLLSIIHIIKAQMAASYFIDGKTTNYHITPNTLAFLDKLKQKKFGRDSLNIKKDEMKPLARSEIQPTPSSDIQPPAKGSVFVPVPAKSVFAATPQANAIGQFFKWIERGIESGKLTYNQADSHIHIVSEKEAIILPNLVEVFAKEIKGNQYTPADLKTLQQLFNKAPTELINSKVIDVISPKVGETQETIMMVNPLNILPSTVGVSLLTQRVLASQTSYPPAVISAIQQQYGQMVVQNTLDNKSQHVQATERNVNTSLNTSVNTPLNVPTYSPDARKGR